MKLILILSLTVSMLPVVAQCQGNSHLRKIVLEEEEIAVLDENGKEIEVLRIGAMGKEKAEVRRKVREKALKSMGLKSLGEIKGNESLAQKFLKEQSRFLKVKKLNPQSLKFVDKDGAVIKEVPISQLATIEISTITSEAWQSRGIAITVDEAEKRKIERRVSRAPVVSRLQNVAVITEITSEFVQPSPSKRTIAHEGNGEGLGNGSTIEYYDDKGDMRWKRKSDRKRIFYPVNISGSGEVVAAIEACELNCSGLVAQGIPLKRIVVFNSAGEEVLSFPKTPDTCNVYSNGFWLSSDGGYLIAACLKKNWPKSFVINLKENKIWNAPYLISVARGEDGYEKREGSKIRIGATDDKMHDQSLDLDLDKLSWEKLP